MTDTAGDLLLKARKGNVEAFEILIQDYQSKIFNLAFKMSGSRDVAGELAQEVFVRVFRAVMYSKSVPSIQLLVYKTAGEVCIGQLKDRKKAQEKCFGNTSQPMV